MTRVNKTQFPEELRKRARKKLRDFDELKRLLTPPEILMLEKRIAILILLEEGKSYREIGRTIDVTPRTISYIRHHFTRTSRPQKPSPLPPKRTPKFHHSSKGVGALLWK